MSYAGHMRALSLLLTALAIACSKPAPPTIAPESATVTAVDLHAVHLSVALTATNPNAIDLPVEDVTAHVVLAGKMDLGTVTLPLAMTLPAGKPTHIDLPVAVQWTDLPALAQMALSPSPVPFVVDGKVELGGQLLRVSVPFEIKGSMTHEQLTGTVSKSLPKILQ